MKIFSVFTKKAKEDEELINAESGGAYGGDNVGVNTLRIDEVTDSGEYPTIRHNYGMKNKESTAIVATSDTKKQNQCNNNNNNSGIKIVVGGNGKAGGGVSVDKTATTAAAFPPRRKSKEVIYDCCKQFSILALLIIVCTFLLLLLSGDCKNRAMHDGNIIKMPNYDLKVLHCSQMAKAFDWKPNGNSTNTTIVETTYGTLHLAQTYIIISSLLFICLFILIILHVYFKLILKLKGRGKN